MSDKWHIREIKFNKTRGTDERIGREVTLEEKEVEWVWDIKMKHDAIFVKSPVTIQVTTKKDEIELARIKAEEKIEEM